MAIPAALLPQLERLAVPFGGAAALETRLSEQQLETILLFPGFIRVISPWALEFDLRDHGFIAGGLYSIYNSRFELVYQALSPNGLFGPQPQDAEFAVRAPHAGFGYLCFADAAGNQQVGLIWVCNELTSQQRQRRVHAWERLVQDALALVKLPFGLPVGQRLNPTLDPAITAATTIKFWFLKSSDFSGTPTRAQVKAHPNAIVHSQAADRPLTLYLQEDGWLMFESNLAGTTQVCELSGDRLSCQHPSSESGYLYPIVLSTLVNQSPARHYRQVYSGSWTK